MCPRSGFRSGGTCEHTLVPVFVPGEHPNVPSFRFLVPGNIRQNHPFGNHPFAKRRLVVLFCWRVGEVVSFISVWLAKPSS